MTEFKSARGHTFVTGKRMPSGDVDHGVISWNDPVTCCWDAEINNEAGWIQLPFDVFPGIEMRQIDDDHIHVGETWEIRYVGHPFVYGVFMLDDNKAWVAA